MKKTIMTAIAALTTWMVMTMAFNLGLSMWVNAFGMKLYTLCVLGTIANWLTAGCMVAVAIIVWRTLSKKTGNV